MENFPRKSSASNSVPKSSSLSFITPSVANLIPSKNLNFANKTHSNRILKDTGAFRTPNKTVNLKKVNSSHKKTPLGLINDRYIPNRMGSNMEASYHLLRGASQKENQNVNCNTTNIANNESNKESDNNQIDTIKRKLIIETCNGIQEKSKILQIHNKTAETDMVDNMKNFYTMAKESKKLTHRVIPSAPERILDAPEFRDDYYLNLIDWSSNNYLAVALNREIFLWNAGGGEITQLMSMDDYSTQADSLNDYITSIAWCQNNGPILAVGNSKNEVDLWDVNRQTRVRSMKSHSSRVGSLAWNQHILTSGSRSGSIHHHDVRVKNHHVGTLKTHDQEICGLKWNNDGRHLASGGNDNLVAIWDNNTFSHETTPLHVFREHTAAVKAVSWCPWQSNILATGGGTADGKIRIWNIYNGSILQTQDVKSQISCLLWSKEHRELISSHGFQLNQLSIWRYQDMTKVCDLTGHTNRILTMAISPENDMIVSAGADETLRLWKCFSLSDKQRKAREHRSLADKKSASCTSLSRCIR
jgi:cell division cycle protein 20 (cofactor of APC complex)